MATDYTKDSRCSLAYLFKEGSGTTVADSTGNGNTGTFGSLGHPAWSSANVPSFAISGSAPNSVVSDASSIIAVTNLGQLTSGNPFTVTFWMYPTSTPAYNPHFMDMGGNMRLGTNFTGSGMSATDLYYEYAGATPLIVDSNTGIFSLNTWTWVAMTGTGSSSASDIHIYTGVAGVVTEVTYLTQTGGTSLTSDSGLYILNRISDSARAFIGNATDIGIFNTVMPGTDLTSIYSYGLNGGTKVNNGFCRILR